MTTRHHPSTRAAAPRRRGIVTSAVAAIAMAVGSALLVALVLAAWLTLRDPNAAGIDLDAIADSLATLAPAFPVVTVLCFAALRRPATVRS